MKKLIWIPLIAFISVFMVFGTSFAWQGRMAGMGDPYGLVQDESDMLIHPAMIMNSSGFRFYTHYQFTYTDVMDWDYNWDFSPGLYDYNFDTSGDEYKSEALIGTAFNLGPGRMGVFFTYDNQFGDYDGDVDSDGPPGFDFELDSKKHDFALSLLYGFPINCTDLGFEAGFAYHNEENKTYQKGQGRSAANYIFPLFLFPDAFYSNIYPYMIPYDSDYYEGFAKASIASELGCNDTFGFTLSGGYIFSGNNEFDVNSTLFNAEELHADIDGDVVGWSMGGGFWLRHKIDDTLSLPFLVSANYRKITRDGNDDTTIDSFPVSLDYEHTAMSWDLEFGCGVDVVLDDTSDIAAGLYYRYLDSNNDFELDVESPSTVQFYSTDMDDIPSYKEQRITLKLAYEKELSSTFAFLAGVDCFYGWADWDYSNDFGLAGFGGIKEKVSMDGHLWGIGLTLGSTINLSPIMLEPFIGAKYQQTDLNVGDGTVRVYGAGLPFLPGGGTNANVDGDYERDQWLFTGGLSLYF